MKFLDQSRDALTTAESRIGKLTAAVDNAERKVAELHLLIAAALDQTESTRAQYEQANARAETLRRHLTAKEEQLSALQQQLRERDQRIASLEKSSDSKDASRDTKQSTPMTPMERLAKFGLALESLDQPGTLYRIAKTTTTIGRTAANDIAIDSNSVSRFHAQIVVEEEGVFLVDLESTNGCKVNENRVTRQMIGNDDAISIGSVKFRFSVGSPADVEARLMQETHVLLDDSVILVPAPQEKPRTTQS